MRFFILLLMGVFLPLNAWPQEPMRLDLKQALTLALKQNPSILISKERVQGAIARVGQSRAGLLPQLNGIISGSRQVRDLSSTGMVLGGMDSQVGPFNAFDARVKLSLDIFNPVTIKRLQAAIRAKESSVAQMDKERQDILAFVANLYVEAKRSRQYLAAIKVVYDYEKEAFEKAQRQVKEGVIDDVALAQAQASFDKARFLIKQAAIDEKQQRLDLLAALGLEDDVPIIFVNDAPLKTLENSMASPQVRLAQANLVTAQAQLAATKAGLLPILTGIADIGLAGKDLNDNSRIYTVGLQATIPFWQGGLTQAQIDEAKAHQQGLTIALEDVKRQDRHQKQMAVEKIEEAKRLVMYKHSDWQASKKMLAAFMRRFDQGVIDEVTMKQAESQYALAKDDYLESLSYYQMALVGLAHARGVMEKLIQ